MNGFSPHNVLFCFSKYNRHPIKDVCVMVMVTPWAVCVYGDSLPGKFLLCVFTYFFVEGANISHSISQTLPDFFSFQH